MNFRLRKITVRSLSVILSTPQFHKDLLSSTQGSHLFSTQNPSVQQQKLLSSTPKTPQLNTKNPSVQHRKPLSSTQPSVQHNFLLRGPGDLNVAIRAQTLISRDHLQPI